MPDWNFNKVFNYWRLANLIHSDTPGRGMYDYTSIDLDDIGDVSDARMVHPETTR